MQIILNGAQNTPQTLFKLNSIYICSTRFDFFSPTNHLTVIIPLKLFTRCATGALFAQLLQRNLYICVPDTLQLPLLTEMLEPLFLAVYALLHSC